MFHIFTAPARKILAGVAAVSLACAASLAPTAPATGLVPQPRFVVGSEQIHLLEAGLRRYEAILENGGWPSIPPGPTIEPGMADARLEHLAQRLSITGDLAPGPSSQPAYEYGAELEVAVRHFQLRHGLEVDGLLGRRTVAALNVGADARVRQVRLNLERARNASAAESGLAVVVNIPSFHATLIRDGVQVWATRVIVGEKDTPTPEMRGMITEIVLNPRWLVPAKIAAEELLPAAQRDPGFLARGGYVLYDAGGSVVAPGAVDLSALSPQNFPYSIVQRPGPQNQLGQIKFVIPNDFGVFLHDTPKKHLFLNQARALSHGCIRTENPLILAGAILSREGWTRAAIDEQLATGKTISVPLGSPVPIDVRYQTVLTDTDGTLFFPDDVYGLDATGPAD